MAELNGRGGWDITDADAEEILRASDDRDAELLTVMTRSLRDWPPKPQAAGEWDPAPFLPGGSRYIPKLMTYGTPVSPTSFIPFKTDRESRDEAAAKVLAILQEQKPQARKRRLPRPPQAPPSYGRIPYRFEWDCP